MRTISASALSLLVAVVAACGGRTALELRDAPAPEPGTSNDAAVDVPPTIAAECPSPAPDQTRFVTLERASVPPGSEVILLAGDHTRLTLLVGAVSRSMTLIDLDPASGRATRTETFGRLGNTSQVSLSVRDGVARVVSFEESTAVLHVSAEGPVVERSRTEIEHGTRLIPLPPAWNGATTVLGGGRFVGAIDGPRAGDTWVPDAAELGVTSIIALHSRRESGRSVTRALFARTPRADATMLMRTFVRTRAGDWSDNEFEPFNSTPSSAMIFMRGAEEADIIYAGTVGDPGHWQVYVDRARGDVDRHVTVASALVTTVAQTAMTIRRDRGDDAADRRDDGYAVIATDGSAMRSYFVSGTDERAERFVETPEVCAGPMIAAGPCGYVLGCREGTDVALVLAVPPTR